MFYSPLYLNPMCLLMLLKVFYIVSYTDKSKEICILESINEQQI